MNVEKADFISLWRAVEGIAAQISPREIGSTSKGHQGSSWLLLNHEEQTEEDGVSEAILTVHAFVFRHSKAADLLLSAIDVLPRYEQPVWLDVDRGMGAPKTSPQTEQEGRRILGLWIRVFKEWEGSYFAWLCNRKRPAPVTTDPYLRFINMGTCADASNIGFVRPVLVRLLDQSGIVHSFGNSLSTRESEPPKARNTTAPAPRFRGPMAEVLAIAWESARDRTKAHSVFAALVELAKGDRILPPLVEASEDGQEVKWLDDAGQIQTFGIKDMRSRMRGANTQVHSHT